MVEGRLWLKTFGQSIAAELMLNKLKNKKIKETKKLISKLLTEEIVPKTYHKNKKKIVTIF